MAGPQNAFYILTFLYERKGLKMSKIEITENKVST